MKKSLISFAVAMVSALSVTAPAYANVTANAVVTETSGILEEVEISALQNRSQFYYVTKVTPERYYFKQFGHKSLEKCFAYTSDIQEFLREGSTMPEVGDLVYADTCSTAEGKLEFLSRDSNQPYETNGIINYGSASSIFGFDTFDEMQSVCDLYYIEWRANLNPDEMYNSDGEKYVFTNKEELLADIEKWQENEWMSRYFVVMDAERGLCFNLSDKMPYYVFNLSNNGSIDFGNEQLSNGDLLYADFKYVMETFPGQISAEHIVNYGNYAAILDRDVDSEIEELTNYLSERFSWSSNKTDEEEKTISKQIMESCEDERYCEYSYVIAEDEYGFTLHTVSDIEDGYTYIPRDFYETMRNPDEKEYEVGDIVGTGCFVNWVNSSVPHLIFSYPDYVSNYGSAVDLIGDMVDVQAEIDRYAEGIKDDFNSTIPETCTSLEELKTIMTSLKGSKTDYYPQHIFYVNSYEDGKYSITMTNVNRSYNKDTLATEYSLATYVGDYILYDYELDLIQPEYRDDFTVGDIIFVNWFDCDGAIRVNHYGAVKKLCSLSDIQESGTIEVPEAKTSVTTKILSDNPADINSDLRTSIADAVLLQNYLLNKTEFDNTQSERADVNDDGNVDVFDMVLLRKIITNN